MTVVPTTLTQAQLAATARLAFAIESPVVALLCGPPGVGKTMVLEHVAASATRQGRCCERKSVRDRESLQACPPPGSDAILLLDDAHEAGEERLASVVDAWRRAQPRGSVVLCGEGRLLTLVARDARLERSLVLRATLGPFTLAETCVASAAALAGVGSDGDRDAVARAIHEITAGIPAQVVRLAGLVALVASATPDHTVTPDDVETIHRRLALQAA